MCHFNAYDFASGTCVRSLSDCRIPFICFLLLALEVHAHDGPHPGACKHIVTKYSRWANLRRFSFGSSEAHEVQKHTTGPNCWVNQAPTVDYLFTVPGNSACTYSLSLSLLSFWCPTVSLLLIMSFLSFLSTSLCVFAGDPGRPIPAFGVEDVRAHVGPHPEFLNMTETFYACVDGECVRVRECVRACARAWARGRVLACACLRHTH